MSKLSAEIEAQLENELCAFWRGGQGAASCHGKCQAQRSMHGDSVAPIETSKREGGVNEEGEKCASLRLGTRQREVSSEAGRSLPPAIVIVATALASLSATVRWHEMRLE